MLAVVVFSLLLGIALVIGGERYTNILILLQEFLELMLMLVGWIMRLAPLGIMALLRSWRPLRTRLCLGPW